MRIILVLLLFSSSLFAQKQKVVDVSDTIPLLGKQIPNFEGTTLDGKKFSLEAHRGKVVVVVFWSLSCAACFKEIPEINHVVKKYPESEVIVVSVMPDTKEAVEKRIRKEGEWYKLIKPVYKNDIINYEIVVDGKGIMEQYSLERIFPKSFVVDQEGVLRKYSPGFLEYFTIDGSVDSANYRNFKTTIDKLTKN